jgi:hypothetical protein
MRPLKEDSRTKRRTVADALEVVRQELGVNEIPAAEIKVGPFQLPSGEATAVVVVVCPDFDCCVSLPASCWFRALSERSSQRGLLKISCLDKAKVCPDGSVVLTDGSRLRAVEVVPTAMPYALSPLEERVLRHVIELTKSHDCYRNLRDDLPQHLQPGIPDLYVLDYDRVPKIEAPPLKLIRAYIEDHDPELKVSNRKIADALAKCGVRIPRRRPRAGSARTARATI